MTLQCVHMYMDLNYQWVKDWPQSGMLMVELIGPNLERRFKFRTCMI